MFQDKNNDSLGNKNINISRYKDNNYQNDSSKYMRNLIIYDNINENSKNNDKINENNNTIILKGSGNKENSIRSGGSDSRDSITNNNIDNSQNIIINKKESKNKKNKIKFDGTKKESDSSKNSLSSRSKEIFIHPLKLNVNQNFSNNPKKSDKKSIEENQSDKDGEGEINEMNSIKIDIRR